MVPSLFHAGELAMLSAAIPLKATGAAAVFALHYEGEKRVLVADPSPRQLEQAQSTHVVAFTSLDELLLAESDGDFSLEDWGAVCGAGRKLCCGRGGKPGADMVLDEEDDGQQRDGPDWRHFIRSTMEAKVEADLHWKRADRA